MPSANRLPCSGTGRRNEKSQKIHLMGLRRSSGGRWLVLADLVTLLPPPTGSVGQLHPCGTFTAVPRSGAASQGRRDRSDAGVICRRLFLRYLFILL